MPPHWVVIAHSDGRKRETRLADHFDFDGHVVTEVEVEQRVGVEAEEATGAQQHADPVARFDGTLKTKENNLRVFSRTKQNFENDAKKA